MKAILEFNLPDDADDFRAAIDGSKYSIFLFDLRNRLREDLKYKDYPEPVQDYIEQLRDYILEEMRENNLPVD